MHRNEDKITTPFGQTPAYLGRRELGFAQNLPLNEQPIQHSDTRGENMSSNARAAGQHGDPYWTSTYSDQYRRWDATNSQRPQDTQQPQQRPAPIPSYENAGYDRYLGHTRNSIFPQARSDGRDINSYAARPYNETRDVRFQADAQHQTGYAGLSNPYARESSSYPQADNSPYADESKWKWNRQRGRWEYQPQQNVQQSSAGQIMSSFK